jgi:hypothetical protein
LGLTNDLLTEGIFLITVHAYNKNIQTAAIQEVEMTVHITVYL